MIKSFLKAKHWQLFILMFGLPMMIQMVVMGSIFSNVIKSENPDPFVIFNYMKFLPIVMVLFMGVFFGWFWSVAIGLQHKIPSNVKMKVNRFKIFFFIPLIYLCLFPIFFVMQIGNLMTTGAEPSGAFIGSIFAIIFPLHLFSMFCMFHNLYFIAKTLKTVELQKEVSFSDFVGEFFMLWFYPVGVWIIQPKINEMVDEQMFE